MFPPVVVWALCNRQGVQSPRDVAPLIYPYVSFGQSLHPSWPGSSAYLPFAQFSQKPGLLVSLPNLPEGHFVHEAEPLLVVVQPKGQMSQFSLFCLNLQGDCIQLLYEASP